MKRFGSKMMILFCVFFGLLLVQGCATDVLVTQGVVAEQKKNEIEQAEQQKKELENKIQDVQKLMDEQKQKTDESGNH